jgi:uncharacterized HAD superfamily protein
LKLKIKFFVEDTHSNAEIFANEGYKVYLLDRDHNRTDSHKLVTRITNPLNILQFEYDKKKK